MVIYTNGKKNMHEISILRIVRANNADSVFTHRSNGLPAPAEVERRSPSNVLELRFQPSFIFPNTSVPVPDRSGLVLVQVSHEAI